MNFSEWCHRLKTTGSRTAIRIRDGRKKWAERKKRRAENKRRRIKIKERRGREKEREGEEEMWAKSVFLSWPAAAKAWPGSTMTHSLAPPVLPIPRRLALAKRPPTPNCRRQSLFQRWQSSFPISNPARDRTWLINTTRSGLCFQTIFKRNFPKLEGSFADYSVAPILAKVSLTLRSLIETYRVVRYELHG